MRVVRVARTEFELENGTVLPIQPPLEEDLSPDEFQAHYDRASALIRSFQVTGSDHDNTQDVGSKRDVENHP